MLACMPLNIQFSQKSYCDDKCNDIPDFDDTIAPLDKLIMSFIMIKLIISLSRGAIMLHFISPTAHILHILRIYSLLKTANS